MGANRTQSESTGAQSLPRTPVERSREAAGSPDVPLPGIGLPSPLEETASLGPARRQCRSPEPAARRPDGSRSPDPSGKMSHGYASPFWALGTCIRAESHAQTLTYTPRGPFPPPALLGPPPPLAAPACSPSILPPPKVRGGDGQKLILRGPNST